MAIRQKAKDRMLERNEVVPNCFLIKPPGIKLIPVKNINLKQLFIKTTCEIASHSDD